MPVASCLLVRYIVVISRQVEMAEDEILEQALIDLSRQQRLGFPELIERRKEKRDEGAQPRVDLRAELDRPGGTEV